MEQNDSFKSDSCLSTAASGRNGLEAAESREESIENRLEEFQELIQKGYNEWMVYKKQFGKVLKNRIDEKERMLTFLAAQITIQKHNDAFRLGEKSFEMGVKKLTDLTEEKYMNMHVNMGRPKLRKICKCIYPANTELPGSIDWRDKIDVTAFEKQISRLAYYNNGPSKVKDNAASSTSAPPGHEETLTIDDLQELVQNCCHDWEEYKREFEKVYTNRLKERKHMLHFLSSLQYIKLKCQARINQFSDMGMDEFYGMYRGCRPSIHCVEVQEGDDTGDLYLPMGDEQSLKEAVATLGPIRSSIDASFTTLRNYSRGIYMDPNCTSYCATHEVLVVGYGSDPQFGDYWIVKNSWGADWGEDGYIRIARNRENFCGIASEAHYLKVPKL